MGKLVSIGLSAIFVIAHASIAQATTFTAAGSFQSEVACIGDWAPDCVATDMLDPETDGTAELTLSIPVGTYDCKVAVDHSWTVNYGAGGVEGGDNITFTVSVAIANNVRFAFDTTSHVLTVTTPTAITPNLSQARALWLDETTIAIPNAVAHDAAKLHVDQVTPITVTAGVVSGTTFDLVPVVGGLSPALQGRYPYVPASSAVYEIASTDRALIPTLLQGDRVLTLYTADIAVDATRVQISGPLDDLFTYDGALGVSFGPGNVPTIKVWAPTARAVTLHLYANATTNTIANYVMNYDGASGVWSISAPDATWVGQFYTLAVDVFAPAAQAFMINDVTDPYSESVAPRSTSIVSSARTQILDVFSNTLKPAGWDALSKPALAAPEDAVLCELHLRDASINDLSLDAARRGTYLALSPLASSSDTMTQLKALADAGVTHVQWLPINDFNGVDDLRADQAVTATLNGLAANAPDQQSAVGGIANSDGYNWGYDPIHFMAPEGSYVETSGDGSARVLGVRQAIAGMASVGLRVVVDQVLSHTAAHGQSANAVLDRIVPGYYHRLNLDGGVESSTCCSNTATEHAMMERLLIDTAVRWARVYKVDGFRFDLMGHHSRSTMVKLRERLNQLTLEADGVDGPSLLLYGEGWNFGEVANNARFVNATQENLSGTGIGTFNDRFRDAVRGGSPFANVREQGFVNGLSLDDNAAATGTPTDRATNLAHQADLLRLGLSGGSKDFSFKTADDVTHTGAELDYNGGHAGYTSDPQETINYVDSHDNHTLADAMWLKAAEARTAAERARMVTLAFSFAALSQGIPFFQAGSERLRSKSFDRNSYNSGDWFNAIAWTDSARDYGRGLPDSAGNNSDWAIEGTLLADSTLAPTAADKALTFAQVKTLLGIRKSSRLFRLRTAAEVAAHVSFENVGASATPGLIVMRLAQTGAIAGDYDDLVVLFNATLQPQTHAIAPGKDFTLHPLQADGDDTIVKAATYAGGTFTVPALSTAVFVWRTPPGGATTGATTGASTGADTAATTGATTGMADGPGVEKQPAGGCGCRDTTASDALTAVILTVWLLRRPRH